MIKVDSSFVLELAFRHSYVVTPLALKEMQDKMHKCPDFLQYEVYVDIVGRHIDADVENSFGALHNLSEITGNFNDEDTVVLRPGRKYTAGCNRIDCASWDPRPEAVEEILRRIDYSPCFSPR